MMENDSILKKILVTGAAGGLAAATIKCLTGQNWLVFAADINPEVIGYYKDNPLVKGLVMDTTDQESVTRAFEYIKGQTEGLDAIIHMAGLLVVGSVAEVPVESVQKVLDSNVLGVYNVNKRFLPLINRNKGRIIMISSETARQTAAPFNGIYTMSKYALEAYSDALRRELAFMGIRVIKIRPGPFKTSMTKQTEVLFTEAERNSELFKVNIAKGSSYLPGVYKKAHDPMILANKILKVLSTHNPRTVYSLRHDIPRTMLDFLPARWSDWLIKRVLS